MTPADPDVLAIPDADSLVQLPWKKEVAWVAADLWMNGEPVAQAPRHVLKRVVARAAAKGYELRTGVECEFFLLTPDGSAVADSDDRQAKPCYDQQALMRRYDMISEICDTMLQLGWDPYQNDHEDANGQFEMNWQYGDALKTADRHTFFKFMVKSLAEKHGLRATFMPKPFSNADRQRLPHAYLAVVEDGKTPVSRPARTRSASRRSPIRSSPGCSTRRRRWPPSPTRRSTPTAVSTRHVRRPARRGRRTRSPTPATTVPT